MNTINITRGSSHRIQIVLTRYGLPMAVTQSSNVEVSVEKVSLGRKIILERTLSATREGVLECAVPAILTAGRYNLIVTGDIEGEGSWRMSAPSGITISDGTEKGDEKLTVQGDSFDVTAEVTVMQGTSGSEEELRERIAEIVQEEYNASEQIREQNEAARQEAEEQREAATAQAVEGAERANAAAGSANDAADNANEKADYAQQKGDAADTAANNANNAAGDANNAAGNADEKAALAQAAATLANEKAEYATTQGDYAKSQGDYAKGEGDTAKEKGDYAKAQGDYAKAQGTYAKGEGDTAKEKGDYAKAQGDYAKAQGDYAKAQGDYAKKQGETAEEDHERAEADHTRAESDHATASANHNQAGQDHTRAESDHTHAESDHITATEDHKQAASDHTTAAADHTTAESDHAAVEVYVDSLGAFDISAYHATGGVLAKYADLTAALGTNGANIPDALRKGGMSVKFVQTSENKYVQCRLMSDSFNTTVANWQGVDDVPTAGSDNLVKSGGVYAEIAKKANIDGYYETMGVGTADNLTGQTERTDDAMYRKTGGREEETSGTASITNIKGQTVVWNQLVDTDTTEVTPIKGRKICTVIDSVKSIITSDGSAIAVSGGTDMVFDLTLIYGYKNEPTTAAQFEADYFKWFGKPLIYEEYDAGSLRSVQLDSLKTTGFNQYNNGQARVIGGLQYQITGIYTTITLNGETVTPDANGLFTPSTTGTLIITGGGNDTCIHISGDRNGEYEPYEEHSVSLPVTTITGKLNGEGESVVVFPDGMKSAGAIADEIYSSNDKAYAIKRVGSVDLGTLPWGYNGVYFIFNSSIPDVLGNLSEISNLKSTYLAATTPSSILYDRGRKLYDRAISRRHNSAGLQTGIMALDYDYKNAQDFKNAINGVILYYELKTPQVYELDTFDLPIRYQVDSDGTEEQIQKSGVQGLAAILTCIYGVDAVKILDKLPQNYISEKSMDNFLAQLNTVTGGTWTKTWNENTGEWDFSFTPNAQTNDINTDETI